MRQRRKWRGPLSWDLPRPPENDDYAFRHLPPEEQIIERRFRHYLLRAWADNPELWVHDESGKLILPNDLAGHLRRAFAAGAEPE